MKNKKGLNNQNNSENNIKKKSRKLLVIIIFVVILITVLANYDLLFYSKSNDITNVKTNNNESIFNKEGELTFNNSKNEYISNIIIEIAETDAERSNGLMIRDKMRETEGMLFIFDYETPQSFWMKNTFLSLDIIFVNKKNEIVKIHKNTEPLSEKSLPSIEPALYVVEVIAGYTEKYNIKKGDKITWRRL